MSSDHLNLAGRTALVTGGNIGIGAAISKALARCGVKVVLTYFSHEDAAGRTLEEIRNFNGRGEALQMDATDPTHVETAVEKAGALLGGHIDILVNNAGDLVGRSSIETMTDDHWFKTINANLTSAFFTARAVLPRMTRGWGRIINMSSLAAQNGGGPGAAAYAAAKGGVISFTRGLSKEAAPKGITVNVLAPGLILDTPFHQTFSAPQDIEAGIQAIPLKRGGTPDDVAHAVLYLASDLGSFVTGEIIEINGGMYFS